MANVLSTTTSEPAACAAADAAVMSTMLSAGLVGVSSHTNFVCSSRWSARPRRDLLGRQEREPVPLRLVDLREHAVDAAVDVVDRDHVVPGREQVHERRHRAEPGRERAAVRRVLERREALLQRRARRVGDARVVVALVDAHRLLHVRGGLVDRRRHRARRRVRLLALVDRAGLEVHRGGCYSGVFAPSHAARLARASSARDVSPHVPSTASSPVARSKRGSMRPTMRSPTRTGRT